MSVYDDNVPQATQTIAQTQPIINENFVFIKGAIGQEHNFDDADDTNTYHLQASMPNMADPVALPAGTNGMYYVSGGLPKYYNGTQVGGAVVLPILAAGQFNGVSGLSWRSSFNINTGTSSRTAEGLYTIKFTNALPNTNYYILLTGMRGGTNDKCFGQVQGNATYGSSVTVNDIKIQFTNEQGSNKDVIMGNLLIFGT